jgi:hypothetical protein
MSPSDFTAFDGGNLETDGKSRLFPLERTNRAWRSICHSSPARL